MSARPHDTPTTATAEEGEVMLDGPDGLAISMTPKAASHSADALAAAAREADAQQKAKDTGARAMH